MTQGIVLVSLDSGQFRYYTEAMIQAESEVMHHFDSRRRDFAPYGFTCEIWEPRQMLRPDRHDEIEINFVDRGSLTYLIGGQRVTVHARRVSAFWAAVPHQVVAFDNVNYYYVVTVTFSWVLQWGLPEQLMLALTQGHLIADVDLDRAALDRQLLEQWHNDVEGRRNTNHEIVVLELRARLLRLAAAVAGVDHTPPASGEHSSPLQQTNLEKAE